jgi:hypothetical protein
VHDTSPHRQRCAADDNGAPRSRPPSLRSVALPKEHGGWGLTFEPILLGLLLAPSIAGLLIGTATMLAFVARTPMRLLLVDHHRDRWLARSRLAAAVLVVESSILIGLVAGATWLAGWSWWIPVALAAPLVAVELWYDARSRSRLLVPELCGALGVAVASPSIVLAAGGDRSLAVGAWLVLAARIIGSIPFVRTQISMLRTGAGAVGATRAAQVASITVGATAFIADRRLGAGVAAIVLLAGFQLVTVRSIPTSATRLGITQMVLGLAVVVVTAAGVAVA